MQTSGTPNGPGEWYFLIAYSECPKAAHLNHWLENRQSATSMASKHVLEQSKVVERFKAILQRQIAWPMLTCLDSPRKNQTTVSE